MKNIISIRKSSITAILALCILFGIPGTCMNVTAMAEKTTVATEENIVAIGEIATATEESAEATGEIEGATEETPQELVPMVANGCCHTYTTTSYSGGKCPTCDQSVSGTAIICSKCGNGWVRLTCGHSFQVNEST